MMFLFPPSGNRANRVEWRNSASEFARNIFGEKLGRKCFNGERNILRLGSQVPSAYHAMCGHRHSVKLENIYTSISFSINVCLHLSDSS